MYIQRAWTRGTTICLPRFKPVANAVCIVPSYWFNNNNHLARIVSSALYDWMQSIDRDWSQSRQIKRANLAGTRLFAIAINSIEIKATDRNKQEAQYFRRCTAPTLYFNVGVEMQNGGTNTRIINLLHWFYAQVNCAQNNKWMPFPFACPITRDKLWSCRNKKTRIWENSAAVGLQFLISCMQCLRDHGTLYDASCAMFALIYKKIGEFELVRCMQARHKVELHS